MPNIKITEQDLTRAGESAVNRDIVYIPGFPGYGTPEVTVDIPTFIAENATNKIDDKMPLFLKSGGWKDISISAAGAITTASVTIADYGITIDGDVSEVTPTLEGTLNESTLTIGTDTFTVTNSVSLTTDTEVTISLNIPFATIPSNYPSTASNAPTYFTLIKTADSSSITISSIDSDNWTKLCNKFKSNAKDYRTITISENGVVTSVNLGENSFKYNENLPLLCEDIETFEKNFGTTPYKFGYASTASDPIKVNINDYDKSWIMAEELINRGLPVLYHVPFTPLGTESSVSDLLSGFTTALLATGDEAHGLDLLRSKSDYDVKYITCGAYPSCDLFGSNTDLKEVAKKMASIAKGSEINDPIDAQNVGRGDCFAIIDHEEDVAKSNYPNNILTKVSQLLESNKENVYATMFTPWYKYEAKYATKYGILDTKSNGDKYNSSIYSMPASFAYLTALAESIKNNPNWYAIAGVNRGLVSSYGFKSPNVELNNTIANALQKRSGVTSINAITYIRPYGYAIWGNRTLKNNTFDGELTATSFLNIRNMVCDIKKVTAETALRLIFEQDTAILWSNFVAGVSTILEKMRGTGISNYKILREKTDAKAKLKATVRIYPLYALEDVEVNIEIRDDDEVVVQ